MYQQEAGKWEETEIRISFLAGGPGLAAANIVPSTP